MLAESGRKIAREMCRPVLPEAFGPGRKVRYAKETFDYLACIRGDAFPAGQQHEPIRMQLYFTGPTSGGDSVPYLMALSQPTDPNPQNGFQVWMNCDDHYDYIQAGEYWTATVFKGSASNLASTSMSPINGWGETTADIAYDAKAYIELNYSANLTTPLTRTLFGTSSTALLDATVLARRYSTLRRQRRAPIAGTTTLVIAST